MDRRDSLKALVLGGLGTGLFLQGCMPDKEVPIAEGDLITEREGYGRTPAEELRDEELMQRSFFTETEMASIIALCEVILPADAESVSAVEAGVPDFISFIVKDIPSHQLPLRGGLMWLKRESTSRFGKEFQDLDKEQQIVLVQEMAHPENSVPGSENGHRFFDHIRNLIVTGYFTSKPGIEYLGYQGNQPNVWDGVPEHVLKEHGLQYDERTLEISIKPEERNQVMDWEEYVKKSI